MPFSVVEYPVNEVRYLDQYMYSVRGGKVTEQSADKYTIKRQALVRDSRHTLEVLLQFGPNDTGSGGSGGGSIRANAVGGAGARARAGAVADAAKKRSIAGSKGDKGGRGGGQRES